MIEYKFWKIQCTGWTLYTILKVYKNGKFYGWKSVVSNAKEVAFGLLPENTNYEMPS